MFWPEKHVLFYLQEKKNCCIANHVAYNGKHGYMTGAFTMSEYSFSLRTDVPRNVVYIEQRGQPSADDLRDLKREYLVAIAEMRPGFAIVNDQREMEPYDDEAMEVAKELVEITNQHMASRVIRIVPANVFSTVRLSSTLVAGKSQYTSIRVASPEEAEEALETFSKSRAK